MFRVKFQSVLCVSVLAVVMVLAAGSANAGTIPGTYVDATLSNTTPGSAIRTDTNLDTDNLWYVYQGRPFGESGTILDSQGNGRTGDAEDCPMLTTSVSGVANGTYNVYAIYWTIPYATTSAHWQIQAAIAGNSLATYTENNGTFTGLSVTSGADTWYERYALLGQTSVTSGSLAVNINDFAGPPTSGGPDARSWYDGVSYEAVASPEPSSMALIRRRPVEFAGLRVAQAEVINNSPLPRGEGVLIVTAVERPPQRGGWGISRACAAADGIAVAHAPLSSCSEQSPAQKPVGTGIIGFPSNGFKPQERDCRAKTDTIAHVTL